MERNISDGLMLIVPGTGDFRRQLAPESIDEYIGYVESLDAEALMTRFVPSGYLPGFDPAGFTILRHSVSNRTKDSQLLEQDAVVDSGYGLGVVFAKNLYLSTVESLDEPMPLLSSYAISNCAQVSNYLRKSKVRSTDVLTVNFRDRYPEVYAAAESFSASVKDKFPYNMTIPDDIIKGFHDYFCVISTVQRLPEVDLGNAASSSTDRKVGELAVYRAS
jgi:hypothetical protein